MNISFFAKEPYLTKNSEGENDFRLNRVSTIIRAKELVSFMGAKYNPREGYENDVCVYLKPPRLNRIKDGDYVDVLDDQSGPRMLQMRPGIKVIAMSGPHYEWLKTFLKNEIVLIPHHHVNFERARRERKEVVNCGYVGAYHPDHVAINKEVGRRLAEVGFNFIPLYNFRIRDDIINFYMQIDIQVIGFFKFLTNVPYYHQTKIVNAMSFGIPTVAGQKLGYRDIDNCYIHVSNLDEFIIEVKKLKEEPEYYKYWSEKGLERAESYHISEIAKLYQALK